MFLRGWKEIRSYSSAEEGRMSREPVGEAIFIHRIPPRAFTSYQAQRQNEILLWFGCKLLNLSYLLLH